MVRNRDRPRPSEQIARNRQQISSLLDDESDSPEENASPENSRSSRARERSGNENRNVATRSGARNTNNRNNSSRDRHQSSNASNRNTTNNARDQSQNSNAAKAKPAGAAKRKQNTAKSIPVKALHQIKYLQQTTHNLIPKSPFCRCVKEALQSNGDYRITKEALEALQDAVEHYMIGVFSDANCLTNHRKQVTIKPSDISLLLYIREGVRQYN